MYVDLYLILFFNKVIIFLNLNAHKMHNKSNSNSFANSNQTKASQNKDAAAWMHIHVCRPIFDFNFNKVIIFLNLNAHKMHN